MLLEGFGYHTRLLDAYPTGVVDKLLGGADLLLLAPDLSIGGRNALLCTVRGVLTTAQTPVLTLSTAIGEALDAESGTLLVPWPSPVVVLAQQIETILAPDTNEESKDRSGLLKELSHGPC